jgi:hypothetical protein
MTTFNLWLEAQAARGDDVGVVALTWADSKGIRPKRFGVDSVLGWLRERVATIGLPEDRALAALAQAKSQFHEVQGNLQATPLVAPVTGQAGPPEPLRAVPDPDQPGVGPQPSAAEVRDMTDTTARAIAEQHGWIPAQVPPQPVPLPPDAIYATPDSGEMAAGDPPQVALLPTNLKRLLEGILEGQRQILGRLEALEPLAALARDVAEAGPASEAFDAGLPVDPLELLEETLPGEPGPQHQGGLYGAHVVDRQAAWEAAYQDGDPAAG